MSTTPLPALPGLDPGLDPKTARLLGPVKEILEVREGRRGDPLQRAATLAVLLALGLADREQLLTLNSKT